MSRKKVISIFFLGIVGFSCLLVPYFYRGNVVLTKADNARFFVVIPVTKFTQSDLPCLTIEIEGKRFLTLLDLGYTRYVSANAHILNAVTDKSFVKNVPSWGFRGNKSFNKLYTIPSIYIGNLKLSPVLLEEENDRQRQEAVLVKGPDTPNEGKLGWKLFKNMALYLDLDHDTMTVCDSLETFQKQGPSLARFVKIPFFLDRELIEFDIGTPKGPLRCFLDSGCTLNHLQTQGREEFYFDEKRAVKFPRFRIGNQEFKALTFHPLPIHIPLRTQATLGMDFLFDHRVFIDFKNRYIYIAAN